MANELEEVVSEMTGQEGAEAPEQPEGEQTETETTPQGEADEVSLKADLAKTALEETAEPPPAEPDVEAILKEAAKPTAPGGAPAGVIRELQEERRHRQSLAEKNSQLERELAEIRKTSAEAGTKTCSVEEAVEKGEIGLDDVPTATQLAGWARNARERDAAAREGTERESKRAIEQMQDIATAQEEQASAVLSPEKVGVARSYGRIVGMGRYLLTRNDAAQIARIVQTGGNGAVELYKRCREALIKEYPTLKESLIGKSRPNAPGNKPKVNEATSSEPGLTQEEILNQPAGKAFAELMK